MQSCSAELPAVSGQASSNELFPLKLADLIKSRCATQTVLQTLRIIQDTPELHCGLDARYQRLHLPLDDVDHANLLLHLDGVVKYIQAAIKSGGSVLVHCAAGISRSATVIVAYLMTVEHLSLHAALNSAKQTAPWISPNPGFMYQLALFADMGCKLDLKYPPYTALLLGQRRQMATLNARPLSKTFQGKSWLCKRCSTLLVTADRVLSLSCHPGNSSVSTQSEHTSGQGVQVQHNSDPQASRSSGPSCCDATAVQAGPGAATSDVEELFVKPQRWMGTVPAGQSLYSSSSLWCAGCKAVIGEFGWADAASADITALHCPEGTSWPLPRLHMNCLQPHPNTAGR